MRGGRARRGGRIERGRVRRRERRRAGLGLCAELSVVNNITRFGTLVYIALRNRKILSDMNLVLSLRPAREFEATPRNPSPPSTRSRGPHECLVPKRSSATPGPLPAGQPERLCYLFSTTSFGLRRCWSHPRPLRGAVPPPRPGSPPLPPCPPPTGRSRARERTPDSARRVVRAIHKGQAADPPVIRAGAERGLGHARLASRPGKDGGGARRRAKGKAKARQSPELPFFVFPGAPQLGNVGAWKRGKLGERTLVYHRNNMGVLHGLMGRFEGARASERLRGAGLIERGSSLAWRPRPAPQAGGKLQVQALAPRGGELSTPRTAQRNSRRKTSQANPVSHQMEN